ncbi:hypothetical protein [Paraburkholderia sediminicola]|uniref:hypothetical protein n=1 Tax=Paraburkholderia sediminicola TaxID=458836 RepID=UPI0038BB1302
MLNVEDIFAPVIGEIAFSVTQTHGSCFFIEFGSPHLRIREPSDPRPDATDRVAINLRRRRVYVVGTWSLLVQDCNWTLTNEQKSVCQEDAPEDMEKLFRGVEGQYLVSVRVVEATKTCTLEFDLGGSLKLCPRIDRDSDLDPNEDQWHLSYRDGSSVGYTNDGSIAVESKSDPDKV